MFVFCLFLVFVFCSNQPRVPRLSVRDLNSHDKPSISFIEPSKPPVPHAINILDYVKPADQTAYKKAILTFISQLQCNHPNFLEEQQTAKDELQSPDSDVIAIRDRLLFSLRFWTCPTLVTAIPYIYTRKSDKPLFIEHELQAFALYRYYLYIEGDLPFDLVSMKNNIRISQLQYLSSNVKRDVFNLIPENDPILKIPFPDPSPFYPWYLLFLDHRKISFVAVTDDLKYLLSLEKYLFLEGDLSAPIDSQFLSFVANYSRPILRFFHSVDLMTPINEFYFPLFDSAKAKLCTPPLMALDLEHQKDVIKLLYHFDTIDKLSQVIAIILAIFRGKPSIYLSELACRLYGRSVPFKYFENMPLNRFNKAIKVFQEHVNNK